MVICQGCGQAFAVPAGYSRNKMQCPGCGVICQVPAGEGQGPDAAAPPPAREPSRESRPPRPTEDDAAAWRRDPEPDPGPAPAPPPPPRQREETIAVGAPRPAPRSAPDPPVRKPPAATVPCRRCGRQIT